VFLEGEEVRRRMLRGLRSEGRREKDEEKKKEKRKRTAIVLLLPLNYDLVLYVVGNTLPVRFG
jgi:hypothetical protein